MRTSAAFLFLSTCFTLATADQAAPKRARAFGVGHDWKSSLHRRGNGPSSFVSFL